jgi:hypothetical protein
MDQTSDTNNLFRTSMLMGFEQMITLPYIAQAGGNKGSRKATSNVALAFA